MKIQIKHPIIRNNRNKRKEPPTSNSSYHESIQRSFQDEREREKRTKEIVEAISEGDLDKVYGLLEKGINIDYQDQNGSLLHYAILSNTEKSYGIMCLLMNQGGEKLLSITNSDGLTAEQFINQKKLEILEIYSKAINATFSEPYYKNPF